jgi:hypothetical protein
VGVLAHQPRNGRIPPLSIYTGVDGGAPNTGLIFWSQLLEQKSEADSFAEIMKVGATNGVYKPAFIKGDEKWGPTDIKKVALGGGSIFNTCNFGLLMSHGCYGTQAEIDGTKYTYLALYDTKHGFSYLRLSDMDFGSTGANGLRWMTLLPCNALYPANVTSMINASKWAANDNLHLLLGATTITYASPLLTALYAKNLVENSTIANAFVNAGIDAYARLKGKGFTGMTEAITFRVMGFNSCIGDTLFSYSDPDVNTPYQIIDTTVFTP